ncbi:MAG: calcineurin-like phosphoesterase C-terminal domain-containing protein [Alistipes sp.]|nr:calcineurin-like phosphoesterase C-terminal domain-containing protein [Alistipes sp.]
MKKTLTLILLLIAAVTVSAQSNFTSTLKAKAKKGVTIYGTVECDGRPLAGVAVSDGYQIVQTNKKGQYALASQKQNGYVFITIPSGYEAVTEGADVVPQFWATLTADATTAERHDFTLKAVDNDHHAIVAVADIHISNHHNDLSCFRDIFIPQLKAEVEQYRKAGIPVYTLCLGDSSHEIYWYDYNQDIRSFCRTLADVGYPTPLFNTMGNHDNDGGVPHSPTVDFDATAKYREAFGPRYYSFNIGKIHYVVLDNIHYINKPGGKKAKGIVGSRNYSYDITPEQLAWLEKDLALVTDKSTPIVIGVHSPIYRYKNGMSGKVNINLEEQSGKALTELLRPFSTVHVLSGHTHRNRITICSGDKSQPELANIVDHNIVAVSGSLWYSSAFGGPMLGSLGEPAGYKIFTMDDKDIKWRFKATQYSADEQFTCFDMNAVRDYFRTNGEVRVFLDHFPKRTDFAEWESENSIMVNIWDWCDGWKIEISENGTPLEVTRRKVEHPQMIVGLDIPNTLWRIKFDQKNNKRKAHPHMFHAVASAPDTTIEVTVTDCFGKQYKQTMVRPKPFSLNMR